MNNELKYAGNKFKRLPMEFEATNVCGSGIYKPFFFLLRACQPRNHTNTNASECRGRNGDVTNGSRILGKKEQKRALQLMSKEKPE